jgi:hypothetical protein
MSNWACNTCADIRPDEYPAECKIVHAPEGEMLHCEICGGAEKLLNVPVENEESTYGE